MAQHSNIFILAASSYDNCFISYIIFNIVGWSWRCCMIAGEWHCMQVAVKVLSSRGNDASMTRDLFESLLSANMHHPSVVRMPVD